MRRPRRRHERKTAERGYGGEHKKQREKYRPAVDAGREFCRRCGRAIPPAGIGPCPKCGRNHRGWDMGHNDFDRTQWTGPEHECCNRATAGRRRRKRRLRISREW